MLTNPPEAARGWLYLIAFSAFVVVLVVKALTTDFEGWEDTFMVLLGLGNGLAALNTSRSTSAEEE